MAEHQVKAQWAGKMQFNATVNNHTIVMDAPERGGGEDNGPIPKPFVLTALSGCAGMELVAFLKKQNIEIQGLNIETNGKLTTQVPFQYTSVNVLFEVKTKAEAEETVVNAVNTVMSTICGVSGMLQKIIPVTWEVSFI